MAGIPGPLKAAKTGQEDNFYPYEETPVEYFHFSGGMVKRFSVELISNYIEKVVFESH